MWALMKMDNGFLISHSSAALLFCLLKADVKWKTAPIEGAIGVTTEYCRRRGGKRPDNWAPETFHPKQASTEHQKKHLSFM